jgi:hypothetical protein
MTGRKVHCNFTSRLTTKLNFSSNCDITSGRLRFLGQNSWCFVSPPWCIRSCFYDIFINGLGLQIKPYDFLFVLSYSKFLRVWPNSGWCWFNVKTVTVLPMVRGHPTFLSLYASRVWFPNVLLEILIYIILPVVSASNRNEYQENFLWVKAAGV